MADGTTPATLHNPAQPPSSTNPIPRSANSSTACNQTTSRRSVNSIQSASDGNDGETGNLIPDENASHSSRTATPTQESSMAENNLPSTTACHQPTSRRSISSTESGYNGIAEGTGNLIPDENAPHSSQIGTPTQESSTVENNLPTTAACHQSTSGRSISSTESCSNGTAGGAGNLIPDENAPYSSRIGTPMQESSTTEKKPMAL